MKALGLGPRIVTGATGFVGSHFVLKWATLGVEVVALSRPAARESGAQRVHGALRRAAESLAEPVSIPTVRTLEADLSRPACGISPANSLELRAKDAPELWHFAASLQYEDRHQAAIRELNVEGTRRALELARVTGAPWFVYVSTAYTAGKKRGEIALELPDSRTEYNNRYEESKAEAERLVVDTCEALGMQYAILRPSIVIGPYGSKSTGGSSTGLYGFVREIARARTPLRNLGRPVELRGDPDTQLNLLPIDWFVEDVEVFLRSEPKSSSIQHHTIEESPTIRDIGELLSDLLELPGFSISPSFSAPRSPLEQLLSRRTAFYAAYLSGTKHFQRALPRVNRLTKQDVRDYLAKALETSPSSVTYARAAGAK